jgi:predicted enzyme related to lactoylglutathione lyase
MISRVHESLSHTIDYIEMVGRLFSLRKRLRGGEAESLTVFYVPETEKILAQETGEEITRETFEFPGGWRFHFREPGGEAFALSSDK